MTLALAESSFARDNSAISKTDAVGHTSRPERSGECEDREQRIRNSGNALLSQMQPQDLERVAIALCNNLGDIIAEWRDLLQQYGPAWYTQQQHERAELALRLINCLQRDRA